MVEPFKQLRGFFLRRFYTLKLDFENECHFERREKSNQSFISKKRLPHGGKQRNIHHPESFREANDSQIRIFFHYRICELIRRIEVWQSAIWNLQP